MPESTIVSKQFTNYAAGPSANLVCRYVGSCSVTRQTGSPKVRYDVYDCDLYLHTNTLDPQMTLVTDCPFDGFASFGLTIDDPEDTMHFSIGRSSDPNNTAYDGKLSISESNLVLDVSGSTADLQGAVYGHERFYAVKQVSA